MTTPMTIPDEAVQAAAKAHTPQFDNMDPTIQKYALEQMSAALTAAAPFLQGVKVRALEWEKADDGIRDRSQTVVGWYFISNPREGQYNLLFDNEEITALFAIYDALEAAKDAAQADYEAWILSALEPFANSYPQGANLAAHSKNENGPDHEQSPRAQALEEAHSNLLNRLNDDIAQLERMAEQAKFAGSETGVRVKSPSVLLADLRDATSAIRSLSSQPVADGWLPIETAPKDGKIDIWATDNDGKGMRITDCYYDRICDEWRTSAPALRLHCVKARYVTHWRPLPSSPGASE